MLSDLAVWYLRKRKKSVVMGFEVKGGQVKSLNSHTFTYDNTFYNVDYRTCDDEPFSIPAGKYSVSRERRDINAT